MPSPNSPDAARIPRWRGPFGFWLDYGSKVVLIRIGRLDILTWWRAT